MEEPWGGEAGGRAEEALVSESGFSREERRLLFFPSLDFLLFRRAGGEAMGEEDMAGG